ncbi:hypothetical protein EVAR_47388_1 [Eumeta japonica]|uniref:Uncharacterized protein n=1 Tax=Eumeta variegata TaxID=151549 RepID=A0A4C1WSQ0_EUMVA|nr:hypothetical protein EVAR_47388_1 [Eumeta japonica]
MLSLSPHCSHKLRPLDRTVLSPLTKAANSTCDGPAEPPGGVTRIYDVPGILATAVPLALSQSNTQTDFCRAGIFPFNRHSFTVLYFAPAFVTTRPNPINAIKAGDQTIQNTSIVANSSTAEDKTLPPPRILTLEPPDESKKLSNAVLFVQQPTENMPQCSKVPEQESIIADAEPLITLTGHRSSSSFNKFYSNPLQVLNPFPC